MKKILNFVVISSVFVGGLFLSNNSIIVNNNLKNLNSVSSVSPSEDEYTHVSDAQSFIDAANANENIFIDEDIDFSEISSDVTIESYSGIINGNQKTISNHNYLNEDSGVTYLFQSFDGVLENITLDNFAFFAEEFEINENNSNQAQISNLAFENITISDANFVNLIDKNSIKETLNIGLFVGSVNSSNFLPEENLIDFEQISINNINFEANLLNYTNYPTLKNLNLGLFSGEILGYGTIDQLLVENINFNDNSINAIYENNFTDFSNVDINLGMFSGHVAGLNITNSYIKNVNINNNTFNSLDISMGSFIGVYENVFLINPSSQFYANNLNILNNTFNVSVPNINIGSLYGNIKYNTDSANGNFNSFILQEANIESNSFYNLTSDQSIDYNIGEVYGYEDQEGYFDSETSYIVTEETNNPTNEFNYINEEELTKTFWEENNFNSTIWDLDNLYLLDSKVLNDNQYGYPPLLFIENQQNFEIPYFNLTIDYNVQIYGNSFKSDKSLTFNLNLVNPSNLEVSSSEQDQVVLTLNSSFYEFDNQNYKEIKVSDFEKNEEIENSWSYSINIDSFVQTQDQLNEYYWIEINDEFSIDYTTPIGIVNSSSTSVISLDSENSDLFNSEPSSNFYDTTESLNLNLNTDYNEQTNELTFELKELNNFDYDLYYSLNLTLTSSTERYDFHLDSNNPTQTVTLDENLPNRLEEGKTINDFYSIDLSYERTNSSYIVYLNESGNIQREYISDLSSEQLKDVSNSVYLDGSLTNTNPSNTLEDIDGDVEPPVEPPVEPQNDNQSTIISISVLVILFVLIILIYLIVHYKNRRKNVEESE